MLDGLARLHAVMHDISDGVQKLVALLQDLERPAPTPATEAAPTRLLFSVDDLADLLGVTASTVRGLRASGQGPTVTKIGRRVFFRREDVEGWLEEQRMPAVGLAGAWRDNWLPGRIGSSVPLTSERPDYCSGSHSEPLSASRYSGRGVCRVCRDDVLVNRDGRLRKHHRSGW